MAISTSSQSYLRTTDSTLMNLSGLLADARGSALGVVGTTATDLQRETAAREIEQIVSQLLDTGNQQFRGRYLFAGSITTRQPFEETAGGFIQYNGNEGAIQSYCDIDLLFQSNVTGNQVFGGLSEPAGDPVDLDPVVTFNTRLSDLRGGEGISSGSIKISDGAKSSIIDIGNAATVGDLAGLLRANPPEGNQVQVEITPNDIRIRLTSGDLSITEVAGGTTAHELGILTEIGAGTGWVTGRDLDPVLRGTTSLDDLLGSYAQAVVRSTDNDNDLIFKADTMGTSFNGVTVRFEDTAPAGGAETVTYNGVDELVVGIKAGETIAADVIAAVNAAHDAGTVPFTAGLDPLDRPQGGISFVQVTSAVTAGGSGSPLDTTSGLQIVNGGQTHTISLATAETLEDVLNILNGAGAGVLAEINADQNGISLRSRISGADFAVGENGGTTATQLGLRTFTSDVALEDFNHGAGVNTCEGEVDFTIQRADGVQLDINLDGAETVQDVLDLINLHPDNADGALSARLATVGNGIRLVDQSSGSGQLTVARTFKSTAAIDLGLIPASGGDGESQIRNAIADVDLTIGGAGANNGLSFAARNPGSYGNATIVFADNADQAATFDYDAANRTITFGMTTDPSGGEPVTTAADIITMLEADPVADAAFSVTLNLADDPSNDGSGIVPPMTAAITGGSPEILTGTDANPQETEGVFTALLRLRTSLDEGDVLATQHAIDLMDTAMENLNFAHAELGARERALDIMQTRLEDEEVELRDVMSKEYDVDIAEVASRLTAQQISYEASLQVMAKILQMSLLDYL